MTKKESTALRPEVLLVIRSSAMGDVAMSAPVLRAFRGVYGQRIVMLTRGFYEPFFDGIDNFEIYNIDLASHHRGVMGTWRLYRELRHRYRIVKIVDLNDKLYSRLLRKFFLFFSGVRSYDIDKGRKEKKMLTRLCGKRLVQLTTSIERYRRAFLSAGYSFEVPNELPARDAGRKLPAFISASSVSVAPVFPVFPVFPVSSEFTGGGVRYIGIAPFAQHRGKRIPIDTVYQFLELMRFHWPQVHIFVFGGGNQEREVAREIAERCSNVTSAIGVLSLREEMDLMANVELMVSMDSSSMHLSSLVGTPVVSVWGATHPYAGFLGMGQSMENVVQVDLGCRPCSIYGHKPCLRGDYACLEQIRAEDIFSRVDRLLRGV